MAPFLRAAVACGTGLRAVAARVTARSQSRPTTEPAVPAVDPAPADADALDYDICPAEGLRRPHAIPGEGSRRCWHCGHETDTKS